MLDLNSIRDRARLFTAIERSRDAMECWRRNRKEMVEDYVGSWYSTRGARFRTIVNLIFQAADAYTIALAANCPKVHITADDAKLRPFAFKFQTAINKYIRSMHLEQTLGLIVLDAFFSIGIAKVHQRESGYTMVDQDVWIDPGVPYMSRVSIDNFVCDMSVKDARHCRFMVDDYRVPWEKVAAEDAFLKTAVRKLGPTSKYGINSTRETAQQISSGELCDDDEYEPKIDLMDVWLPEIDGIATFARDTQTEPLLVRPCKEEGGPYHILSFADVPDSILGSAPAQHLKELHDVYNMTLRKLVRQAARHKVNTLYRPGAEKDADRMKRANDGEFIASNDPTAIKTVEQGGIVPTNIAFSAMTQQLFDRMSGNLQEKLGLGMAAGTLGQEELIAGKVGRQEAKLQNRTGAFTAEVLAHLGYLLWMDELLEVPNQVQAYPGSTVMVDVSWTPGDREGRYWQYQFSIERYSMAYEPAGAKAQKITGLLAQIIPLAPLLQQAGGNIDVQRLVHYLAELNDCPEFEDIVTFAQPVQEPMGMGDMGGGPPNTTRQYVRKNVSMGPTQEAQSNQLLQGMMRGGAGNGSRTMAGSEA